MKDGQQTGTGDTKTEVETAIELQGMMTNAELEGEDQTRGVSKAKEFLQEDSLSGEKV